MFAMQGNIEHKTYTLKTIALEMGWKSIGALRRFVRESSHGVRRCVHLEAVPTINHVRRGPRCAPRPDPLMMHAVTRHNRRPTVFSKTLLRNNNNSESIDIFICRGPALFMAGVEMQAINRIRCTFPNNVSRMIMHNFLPNYKSSLV